MIKIKTYTVGKIKEKWLEEALADYHKRLATSLSLEWVIQKELSPPAHYIALDPKGELLDSLAFSALITSKARHTFVIGGAEGLTEAHKQGAQKLISFSPLTFTHQLTRLILAEQLYRAMEISRGSPYHK